MDKNPVLIDDIDLVLLVDLLHPTKLLIRIVLVHHFTSRVELESNDVVCIDLVDLFSFPAAVWLDEKFEDLGAPILKTLHAVDVIVEADEHV